jgi:hypothetical protein
VVAAAEVQDLEAAVDGGGGPAGIAEVGVLDGELGQGRDAKERRQVQGDILDIPVGAG